MYRNNNDNNNNDDDISENLGFSQLPITQIRNMRFLLIGNDGFCRWSKGEQSTALSTATSSSLQVSLLESETDTVLNCHIFIEFRSIFLF